MNNVARIISTLAIALAASVHAQPTPDSSSLLFRNGDLLYGQLLAIDAPNAVRWRHPDASEPVEFKPDTIAQIDFPVPTNSTARPTNACRLLLANGDTLEGGLVSCDHEAVVLQTWYAGALSIPRAALQSLVFIPRSTAVFDGITGLDGWTQGLTAAAFPGESGQWTYRNGAFYASKPASIARDLKLPDVAQIQFDVAWKGSLNLAVALYTDSLQPVLLTAKEQGPDFGGFYSLRFAGSAFIDLWPVKKMDRERKLGQLFIPSLNNKDRVRVDLRVNKPEHKFALFLDDALVKQWDDPEGFIGAGTAMRFVQNPGCVIKLSNLRISQWDGILAGDASADAADATHDAFWPEKGAKVSGVIESIANGKMTASTTNGPVEIPLTEIKSMDFAHRPANPAQTPAATVRGTFAQGGALTFILESWKPGEMIIRSADFGKAALNPAAFTRLQFLVPEKKTPEGPKG
jgi:hypothetical protein